MGGGESLGMDLDFSLLRNKGVSVFCRKEWLGAGEPLAPPNRQPVNKTLFLPHQLLCYTYVWQQAAKSHFGNKERV